ncbi:hypothetical protein PGT21_006484 [Puccinia graminis f. sp. tritici]|uniref:Uncharacterized protein n=1 Tax=Puccinia graminis f. sp. tritici TaxID=56615 RepID=A0A5B0LUI3_PUCGR|nr:hypothetical protein PGT21_006484 [Puccinia graminis f. sp. tritici]
MITGRHRSLLASFQGNLNHSIPCRETPTPSPNSNRTPHVLVDDSYRVWNEASCVQSQPPWARLWTKQLKTVLKGAMRPTIYAAQCPQHIQHLLKHLKKHQINHSCPQPIHYRP